MTDETNCSICTEIKVYEIVLSCNHGFCDSCIITWSKTKKNCPLCRKPFTSKALLSFEKWIENQVTPHVTGDTVKCSEDFLYSERIRLFGH